MRKYFLYSPLILLFILQPKILKHIPLTLNALKEIPDFLGAAIEPGISMSSLPLITQDGLKLLIEKDVKAFNLSQALMKDPEILQRFIEGAYPIVFQQESAVFLSLLEEELLPSCQTIGQNKYVKLIDCH